LAADAQDLLVGDPGPQHMFDDRVYKRGALAVHAVRLACGDLAFFALLQEWTARHRHGSVSTHDFILAVDRATALDTEALLHPWLYEEVLPPLPVR
jgi:aminopeptidase N